MKPTDYLTSELQHCAHYELSDADQTHIAEQGIEQFIYSKLTSKKFRKWAIDDSSEQQVKRAVQIAVSDNKPIQFRYPFGGYKLWRLPSTPEVDWAEFFSIAYYSRYLAAIAASYEAGVQLIFSADEVIIERMNNIPKADTEAYFNSFKKLLVTFQEYFPANFKIDIPKIGDLYDDKTAMENELSDNVERIKKKHEQNTDEDAKQKMYTMSELNITWDGAKDLTGLSAEDKQQIIEMGPIYHDAYCALTKRRAFNRGEDKILLFATVLSNSIAIGTTKSSVAKFWLGLEFLKKRLTGTARGYYHQTNLKPTIGRLITTCPSTS